MRRQRNLTIEGRTVIIGRLTLLSCVFLAHVLPIPNEITTTIRWIQREFLWNSNHVKIKYKIIDNDFQNEALKNEDISSQMSCLQCPWIKKLYDQNSNDFKLIPIHFSNNAFEENSIFKWNLSFKTSVLHQFPTFYANTFQSCRKNFSHIPYIASCIESQFICFNNYITIDNNYIHFK